MSEIKRQYPGLLRVTPGIRWPDGPANDQRRVADPISTLAAGADLLVIGRMVTEATDPEAALHRLIAEIA